MQLLTETKKGHCVSARPHAAALGTPWHDLVEPDLWKSLQILTEGAIYVVCVYYVFVSKQAPPGKAIIGMKCSAETFRRTRAQLR